MTGKPRPTKRRDPILPATAYERWRRQAGRWFRRSPGAERSHGLFLRRFVVGGRRVPVRWLLVVAAAGWMVYSIVAGEQGILSLLSQRAEKRRLASRIESLERRQAFVRQRLRETSQDPFLLEKQAREVYGMARPGEIVYQFSERELLPAAAREPRPDLRWESLGSTQEAALTAAGVDSPEDGR